MMRIRIHLPRKSEASIQPFIDEDIIVTPKFYKRTGWVPIFYFTTIDAGDKEERHVLSISAANKYVRVEKLNEVVPACDEPIKKQKKESHGTASHETPEDKDVHGATGGAP
jgi:hypothetical protein